MTLTGQRRLSIDRAAAWRALNDPEVLRATIPGCESIERTAENEYALMLAAVLGPVRARFRGKLSVEDIVAPQSYTLRFEGDGGAAGFARGDARVSLADDGGATRLDYEANAQVGGRIAQVGNRLVDAAARKLAEEFFSALEAHFAPIAVPAAAGPVESPPSVGLAMLIPPLAMIAALAAIAWLVLF